MNLSKNNKSNNSGKENIFFFSIESALCHKGLSYLHRSDTCTGGLKLQQWAYQNYGSLLTYKKKDPDLHLFDNSLACVVEKTAKNLVFMPKTKSKLKY